MGDSDGNSDYDEATQELSSQSMIPVLEKPVGGSRTESYGLGLQNSAPITHEELNQWEQEIALIDEHLQSKKLPEKSLDVKSNENDDFQLKEPPDISELLSIEPTTISPTTNNCHVLNVACQNLLKRMEKQITQHLEKNRSEQAAIISYLNSNKKIDEPSYSSASKIKCAGMPYFKDLDGYPPPFNEDCLKKRQNKELLPVDFMLNYRSWSSKDTTELKNAVFTSARDMQISKIIERKNEYIKSGNSNLNAIVKDFDDEIARVKSMPVTSLDIDSKTIDWMKISTIDMQGKYIDTECESKWVLDLSPTINKAKWKQDELKNLDSLAEKNNFQNWNKVAEELGTNRTGFQCCVIHQSRRNLKEGKWTKAEDEKLLEFVEKYKKKDYIPWSKISWYFQTRSSRQCQERYIYHLRDIRKGDFDDNEDERIVYGAKRFGLNFNKVSKLLPDRVTPQIRARYEYLVGISMPEFSEKEDELLLSLIRVYSRNWEKISENFENRTILQCRRRWYFLQRKLKLKGRADFGCSSEEESSAVENIKLHSNISDISQTLKSTTRKKGRGKNNKIIQLQNSLIECISSCPDQENAEANLLVKLMTSVQPDDSLPKLSYQSDSFKNILQHQETCHEFLTGPKPRKPNTPEGWTELCNKMKIALATLSVEADLSTKVNEVEHCQDFDSEDRAVLIRVAEDSGGQDSNSLYSNFCVNKVLVPPNYSTLLGLRTLTLGRNRIRTSSAEVDESWPSLRNASVDPESRLLFSDAKELWKSRIKSLFMLPMICSYIPQVSAQPNFFKAKIKKSSRPSKRKLKAHAVLMSHINQLKKKHPNLSKEELKAVIKQEDEEDRGEQHSKSEEGTSQTVGTYLGEPQFPKKKRGRPPKIREVAAEDAEIVSAASSSGIIKRKRGRPTKKQSVVAVKIEPAPQSQAGNKGVKRARMIRVTPLS